MQVSNDTVGHLQAAAPAPEEVSAAGPAAAPEGLAAAPEAAPEAAPAAVPVETVVEAPGAAPEEAPGVFPAWACSNSKNLYIVTACSVTSIIQHSVTASMCICMGISIHDIARVSATSFIINIIIQTSFLLPI